MVGAISYYHCSVACYPVYPHVLYYICFTFLNQNEEAYIRVKEDTSGGHGQNGGGSRREVDLPKLVAYYTTTGTFTQTLKDPLSRYLAI